MSAEKKRICWVDDRIDELEEYVEAIRSYGYSVDTAGDRHTAESLLSSNQYDRVFVDRLMPDGGDELCMHVRKVQPKAKPMLVTSYGEIIELNSRKFPVLDKADMFRCRDQAEELENLLCQAIEHPADSSIVPETHLTNITFEQFDRMSGVEKIELLEVFEELYSDEISKIFAEGAAWILFCGSNEPLRIEADLDQALSDRDVYELSRKIGYAPFQFYQPVVIDDVKWGEACNSNSINTYPILSIDLDSEFDLIAHFDTGSRSSFVRRSAVNHHPDYSEETPGSLIINGKKYIGYNNELSVRFRSEVGSDSGPGGTFSFLSLRDWCSSWMFRGCEGSCVSGIEIECTCRECEGGTMTMCLYRNALLGRNLLTQNDITIELDGKRQQTRVKRSR